MMKRSQSELSQKVVVRLSLRYFTMDGNHTITMNENPPQDKFTENGNECPIERLPNEVLVAVFQKAPKSLNTISCVCRRWNVVVNEVIGRCLKVPYYDCGNPLISREEQELQYLQRLFSERVGFRSVKVCASLPFYIEDPYDIPHPTPTGNFNSPLPSLLQTWITENLGGTKEGVNKYEELWKQTLVTLKGVSLFGNPSPEFISVLMKTGSRMTTLVLTSRSLARFPSTGEGAFIPHLDYLKTIWLKISYVRDEEQECTLAFLHKCRFVSLENFRTSLYCTSFSSAHQMMRLWQEMFGFLWNHESSLRSIHVTFRWHNYHMNLATIDALPEDERQQFDEFLQSIQSRPLSNLTKVAIVDMSGWTTESSEGSMPFFYCVWPSFVGSRRNLDTLILDLRRCTTAEVLGNCANNKETLKTLIICNLTLPPSVPDSPSFDCGPLKDCKVLKEVRLKFRKTPLRRRNLSLTNIPSLPLSIKIICFEGLFLTNQDANFLTTSLPRLDIIYLKKIRVDKTRLYGKGYVGCEGYGIDVGTVEALLQSRKISKIYLAKAVAHRPPLLPEGVSNVLRPRGYYEKVGFPKSLELNLNAERTRYERHRHVGERNAFDSTEDWNKLD